MEEQKHEILQKLYDTTLVPFVIISKTKEILYSYPESIRQLYTPQEFITTLKNQATDDVTVLEISPTTSIAICELDDESYIATVPIRQSNQSTIHLGMTLFLMDTSKISEFLTVLEQCPVLSTSQLIDYVSIMKYVIDERVVKSIHYINTNTEENSDPIVSQFQMQMNTKAQDPTLWMEDLCTAVRQLDYNEVERLYTIPRNFEKDAITNDPLQDRIYSSLLVIDTVNRIAIEKGVDTNVGFSIRRQYLIKLSHAKQLSEIDLIEKKCMYEYIAELARLEPMLVLNPVTREIIKYIKLNRYSHLTLSDVCNAFQMSQSTISSMFKKDTGFTIHEYIMIQKVRESAVLLQKTNLSISEISNLLCFSSQSHFTECFKKSFGLTPLQYRTNSYKKDKP